MSHPHWVTPTKRLREDPHRLVSAFYLPGGEFATTLGAARGWAAKTNVCLSFVTRLRFAPLYAFTVVAVAVVLNHGVGSATRSWVILANSTNVQNLRHHKIWTLVTSAFITDGTVSLLVLAELLLLLAIAELLWGWRRLVTVFFLGNAVASCLIYVLLRAGVRDGWLDETITVASDVGSSYGIHAVSGAIIFSLPVRARRLLVPMALLATAVPLIVGRTFTDLGHLLATLVGFVVGWQLRRRPLAARVPHPIALRAATPMAHSFASPTLARAGLVTALQLQEHHRVNLGDAAVAWADSGSRVRVSEARDMRALDGALVGAACGVVAATLVGLPIAGSVVGAVIGAIAARVHDSGLTDRVIESTARTMPPSRAVLLLLAAPADHDLLADALEDVGGEPIPVAGAQTPPSPLSQAR
jgi:uncharacterized membrane protein